MNLDIFKAFPSNQGFFPYESGNTLDPEHALYNLRSRLFSGYYRVNFIESTLNALLFKGRPLILIYQSDIALKFGKEALDMATETFGIEYGANQYTADIEPVIVWCYSSLLSLFPVIRNFSPSMLVVNELFDRLVYDNYSGTILVSSDANFVLLYVSSGKLLEIDEGKVVNRFPINESPVTPDMAKAIALMSSQNATIDIYEVPENLYIDLASWRFGIPFSIPVSIELLKDSLIDTVLSELPNESDYFVKELSDIGTDLAEIENFCENLESNENLGIPKIQTRKISDSLMIKIIEYKNDQHQYPLHTKFYNRFKW